MNINRINEVWAGLGKIVRLAEIGDEAAGTIRAHMVATLQQFGAQAGGGDYYDDFIRVVIPLETRVQPSIAALDRIRALARASAEAYVRVLATVLGLSATAATAAILEAFAEEMVGASGMLAPSGRLRQLLR